MRTRDRDAQFRDFYVYEAPRLRRVALMLTGDGERAADLAHDALIKTYVAWSRIRGDDPAPYARRVLVNLCRNAHRRRLVEMRKTPPAPSDVVDRSDDVANAMQVAAALSVLSPIRRAVVLLRFYEDMTEADIARLLDRPLNTVKSDLRRALDKLRPMFEDDVRETR
jgi:RNA polymerase sigma-70 factor (sigma-E family)